MKDISQRRRTVAQTLLEIGYKSNELNTEGHGKEEEKRAKFLHSQMELLLQMNEHLKQQTVPGQLVGVHVEVSGSAQATIEFDPLPDCDSVRSEREKVYLVIKYLGIITCINPPPNLPLT